MTDERVTTLGIDVGSSQVKAAVIASDAGALEGAEVLGTSADRIRRRDPSQVVAEAVDALLDRLSLDREALAYIATTGEGEWVDFRTGHFYGMTTHARGALLLEPEARGVIDIGALHCRAILMDERGKVLGHKMTSQCASGSGQFLENIARYLGVTLDEVGELSQQADDPEKVSSICAVLAETDVINMVSRGIETPNILKGIHLSMAGRYAKLLRAAGVKGVCLVTGGLSRDTGLVAAVREEIDRQELGVDLRAHEDSTLAGALGAALWGAYRKKVLERRGVTLPGAA